jgi:small subunit ribosomal protein S17
MAKKTLVGTVVSTKMTGSAVVEIKRKTPHPVYKKLMRKSKKFVVDTKEMEVTVGDTVKIVETPKQASNKYFKVLEVIK